MLKNKLELTALALAALLSPALALEIPAETSSAKLTLPDGFNVTVELAVTREESARGLMFRESLAPDRGMLFLFGDPGMKTFWMKNTLIDLDMVFLDADLKVVKVFKRVPKSRLDEPESKIARASSPGSAVLELAAGTAAAHKLKPGSKIKISFPPQAAGQ